MVTLHECPFPSSFSSSSSSAQVLLLVNMAILGFASWTSLLRHRNLQVT